MDKPKKSSMAAADDYSDSYNEVREELNGQLSSRYPSDNFWVSIVDFGTDWVIYRVEDSTYDCTYYQAPYSNTDNGLSIGSPVEVHQVWTPVS